MDAGRKEIKHEDDILSLPSPADRLDAAFKMARETFRKTKLRVRDFDNAVKAVLPPSPHRPGHEKTRGKADPAALAKLIQKNLHS
jgi:hypothetical protein